MSRHGTWCPQMVPHIRGVENEWRETRNEKRHKSTFYFVVRGRDKHRRGSLPDEHRHRTTSSDAEKIGRAKPLYQCWPKVCSHLVLFLRQSRTMSASPFVANFHRHTALSSIKLTLLSIIHLNNCMQNYTLQKNLQNSSI